jgi:hypothetical protein
MDILNANTEPFCRFHLFHEEFNRSTKVAFGALDLLVRGTARTVLPTGEEPWGEHTEWRNPARESSFGHEVSFHNGSGSRDIGFRRFLGHC